MIKIYEKSLASRLMIFNRLGFGSFFVAFFNRFLNAKKREKKAFKIQPLNNGFSLILEKKGLDLQFR
jgi:hypothetical protein